MPDNDILGLDLDDFELPPLPARPVKVSGGQPKGELAEAPEAKNIDKELPPMPDKLVDNSLDEITKLPEKELPPADIEDDIEDEVEEIKVDDDFDLPPLKTPSPEVQPKKDEDIFEFEDTSDEETEEEKAKNAMFDFEDEYEGDLDQIDTSNLVLEEMTRVSPIRTRSEESARNIKESIRMNDLAMEMQNVPVLDDLSDEYAAPKKKAESLVDKNKLEEDEKRILKQRLEEDLSKRPENFNARASQNMYNRLMEEKKLKVAKKGFAISLLPIFMGIASAVISFTQLNWGDYLWFQYIAVFMVVAALMLFVKSKQVKMLSVAMYAICLLLYVGPGLVLYVLDEKMQQAPDKVVHLVFTVAACALNIISIIILTKNEAVNIYYNSNFKKK